MNARRIFAAAAIAIASAACSGGSPTLAANPGAPDTPDEPEVVPTAPPTDTTGFVPPPTIP